MSKYTTEVRFICETEAGYDEQQEGKNVDSIILDSLPSIFDFEFPIFDESYRSSLEKKILKHYYTREIGLETVSLWKLKLNTKLNEIMPYYNQLYKSALIDFNPLYSVDLTKTYSKKSNELQAVKGTATINSNQNTTGNIDGTMNSSGGSISDGTGKQTTTDNGTASKKEAYSDTPQGSLAQVESLEYLSHATVTTDTKTDTNVADTVTKDDTKTHNAMDSHTDSYDSTISKSDTNSNSDTTINNLEDYTEKVMGNQGSQNYSHLLRDFRSTFLNIDLLIIHELGDLFMNLW